MGWCFSPSVRLLFPLFFWGAAALCNVSFSLVVQQVGNQTIQVRHEFIDVA
ncbi:hypothetical protein IF2G_09068 [Cordyceps javanica]|nr:hypothetical protein IF2G_09068 [Cordyceps javanica]